LVFQFANLIGDGSRGYTHFFSSTRETQVSGGGIESAECAEAWKMFNHGGNVSIFKRNLMINTELVVFLLNRNVLSIDHQQRLMKVKNRDQVPQPRCHCCSQRIRCGPSH
jgi:hypothetical protein